MPGRDAAPERPAGLERGRARPLRPAGVDAPREVRGPACHRRVRQPVQHRHQHRPEDLGRRGQPPHPDGDPLRARLPVVREAVRAGRRAGPGDDPDALPRAPAADRAVKRSLPKARAGVKASGISEPEDHDVLPLRAHDQRHLVRDARPEDEVEPRRGRNPGRPRREARELVPRDVRCGQAPDEPVVLGPGLPGPERLPRLHAGRPRREPRELGRRQGSEAGGGREEGRSGP